MGMNRVYRHKETNKTLVTDQKMDSKHWELRGEWRTGQMSKEKTMEKAAPKKEAAKKVAKKTVKKATKKSSK